MGQAVSLSKEDSSLLMSNKELLWKSFSKNKAQEEMAGILSSLEKCPSQNVTVAINCNGVTKQTYDADINKKTEAGCADTTACQNAIKIAEEAAAANTRQIVEDENDPALDDVPSVVVTNHTIKVIEKAGDGTTEKKLDDVKGKTLQKDSSIVLTFESSNGLTSANFKWHDTTAPVACVPATPTSTSNKTWRCDVKTGKDVPNFDKDAHVLFDVDLVPAPASGKLTHNDWGFGAGGVDPPAADPPAAAAAAADPDKAGFDNIVSILNPCDKKRRTYLLFLLLVTLALIMLNKDEVMKCVKKFIKMIC